MSTYIATHSTTGEKLTVRAPNATEARLRARAIWRDREAGIMARRRSRETGTTILLVDRTRLPGADSNYMVSSTDGPEQRWETICDEHSTVCSHETRAVAESFMAVPTEWCEDCAR